MIAIAATLVSAVSLVLLHVLGLEFAPSWRMVSEYANGRYPWLQTIVFGSWALSSFALLAVLQPLSASKLGMAGLIFLFLAVVGQTMGALFDINHKLRGPAAMIGIPALCVAAVLSRIALVRRAGTAAPPAWSAHAPWLSFVLMLGTFALFAASLQSAGIDMSAQSGPLAELPQGVTAYVGRANRLLFAASFLWAVLIARSNLQRPSAPTITN